MKINVFNYSVKTNKLPACELNNLRELVLGGTDATDEHLTLLSSHASVLGELSLAKCAQYEF